MERVSLDGEWTLTYYPQTEREVLQPTPAGKADAQTIPARVPGNVELDLQRAGAIEDPFFDTRIFGLRSYEHFEWWYEREFDTPAGVSGKSVWLVFRGLDCLATILLNGEVVGEADNMLIPWRFEVSGRLRDSGNNRLAVRIRSAVLEARSYPYEPGHMAMATNYEQLYVRKAPHMYGWDIAPRAVSAGIWRGVDLEIRRTPEWRDVHYATESVHDTSALLRVCWQFAAEDAVLDGYTVRIRGECGESSFTDTFQPLFTAGERRIRIAGPKLWWPKGYGAANLYDVSVELLRNGTVVDDRHDAVGIRTVTLERTATAGEEGEFRLLVNNVPVFCRGSNWVPLDAFHSRDAERYEPVLELFDDLGCNIIRCWGGNVYEEHAFFRFCDRHGIMVWQDFAFACALYPQEPSFLDRVRYEAKCVVRMLRNHPSLVLWAGDNEIDVFYRIRGMNPWNNLISRRVLPEVCAELDPYRPYLESSPFVSREAAGEPWQDTQLRMPEQHLWGPRDYFKGPFYAGNTAHFASEIGYHGCPNVSSIRRFIADDALWPWQDNHHWRAHASDPVEEGGPFAYRIKLMADQIAELFGSTPDTLEQFAVASQISQGEAKKYFIEMFRMRKWRKTGIIWWNVMDCWPQFSDAIVDYYFAKKLAYWYIRRVQVPVCVMVDEPANWHCRVMVANDTREDQKGTCTVRDAESGAELFSGEFGVKANGSAEIGRVPVSHGAHRVFLITWESNGARYGNHYLLGKPPFDLGWYRSMLESISGLPGGFDAGRVGE
jgi:beta-mannosidase